MKLELRPYQAECLSHAKERNTIVCLPTGYGKTLIAAALIEHYLHLHPEKRVVFLVPTRPLVEQMSGYCEEHCVVRGAPPAVTKLVGDNKAGRTHSEWAESLKISHIMVCTPAVFQKAVVTDKYIDVVHFSLLVFDECHNATGNSPMAAIMRDAVAPYVAASPTGLPRILGLTASIIIGKTQRMEKKRRTLEALLNSTIICPKVDKKLDLENFSHIRYKPEPDHEKHQKVIETHIQGALDAFGHIKDIKKVISHCIHVFAELGKKPMSFYIEKVIIQQIEAKVLHLETLQEAPGYAQRMKACLPQLRAQLPQLSASLQVDLPMTAAAQTLKLKQLLDLLNKNFTQKRGVDYRGIVFVEQVALVSALSKAINDMFQPSGIRCGAVAGTSAQTEADRQEQLLEFKTGQSQVLVATAALEEGIDVSECKFVVRYNYIPTTKGHIQGAGRARHRDAEIFYFDNCPVQEIRKEGEMTAVARNQAISLTQSELDQAASKMKVVGQVHPYPFGASAAQGEVNVFNCKQVFVEYCARVLGTSIRPPQDLYTFETDATGRKILISIRYPTPDGWRVKKEDDYTEFWSGVDMNEVFDSDRVKRKKTAQKEEMSFVYMVVVDLRESGLLDSHNNPTEHTRFQTKRACPLGEPLHAGLVVKDKVVQSYQQGN